MGFYDLSIETTIKQIILIIYFHSFQYDENQVMNQESNRTTSSLTTIVAQQAEAAMKRNQMQVRMFCILLYFIINPASYFYLSETKSRNIGIYMV